MDLSFRLGIYGFFSQLLIMVKIVACHQLLFQQNHKNKKDSNVNMLQILLKLKKISAPNIGADYILLPLLPIIIISLWGCAPMNTHAEESKQPIYDEPYYWPYPNVAPPKLPEAPKDSSYRPGMSQRDYFNTLCEREAGEFIYKTVDNVEGIYQIRPRHYARDPVDLHSQYALEDPYGYESWEAEVPHYFFTGNFGYSFFEASDATGRFIRYSGYDGRNRNTLQQETVPKLKARYGYFWRGIERPYMRDMIIAGGELVIVDLQTNEILALKRGFAFSGNIRNAPNGISWLNKGLCSTDKERKQIDYARKFIKSVLKPKLLAQEGIAE